MASTSPLAKADLHTGQDDDGEINCTVCGSTIAVVASDDDSSSSDEPEPPPPVKKVIKAKPPPPVKRRAPKVKPGQLRFKAVRHVTRLAML